METTLTSPMAKPNGRRTALALGLLFAFVAGVSFGHVYSQNTPKGQRMYDYANDENTVVVLDIGSGFVKAGFAGQETPQVVFPNVVGRPKHGPMLGVSQKTEYIGDEAMKMSGILDLSRPVENGIVQSWDDVEKVLHHTFYNKLRVSPNEVKGVIISQSPRIAKEHTEKLVSILFETFEVKNLYFANTGPMSMYSAGRTTGLVVDSGYDATHTIPVFEGFELPHAIEKMVIAGNTVTNYAQKLLLEDGHQFTSTAELEIVNDIKEKFGYVAQNYKDEKEEAGKSSTLDRPYTLPDKQVITVKATVRMGAPELMFDPKLNGMTEKNIAEATWTSIAASDIDVRKDLCKNIVLSGGNTMFEGFADRLKAELVLLAPSGAEIRVVAAADREYAVWKGMSVLAFLSTFESSWVTQEDYEEHGAAIIHRKCN